VARRAQPVPPVAAPSHSAVTRTRRAQVQRAEPATPAQQSLADLMIGYDHPTNFAERAAASVEGNQARRSGIRTGVDWPVSDEVATMQIPQPPVVSHARPPRPKFDYTRLRLVGASRFTGRTIRVLLMVDPRGHVREVQLLEGVDRDLDRRTVALVHNFEFEPALDDDGVAIRGTQRWNIQIVEDEDESPFKTGLEHHL
jgi:TonB family protein